MFRRVVIINKNVYRKLKLKLKMLYIIYPLIISYFVILFFISKGVIHYLLLLMSIGSLLLGILSYIGISKEIKNNNITDIKFISKKYIVLSFLCTTFVILLLFYLYRIFN